MPDSGGHWDDVYRDDGTPWGESPSRLAAVAVERLRGRRGIGLTVLDVGCGYGRDSRFLSAALEARVLGVDRSAEAIAAARARSGRQAEGSRSGVSRRSSLGDGPGAVDYRQAGFGVIEREVRQGVLAPFDVVFASNLYQLLRPDERAGFRRALGALLEPAGLLFLSTLSTNDPQHYGRGDPVPGEHDSFVGAVYLHFCRDEELSRDFRVLAIDELREDEYDEPHTDGPDHHHVSWILIGQAG